MSLRSSSWLNAQISELRNARCCSSSSLMRSTRGPVCGESGSPTPAIVIVALAPRLAIRDRKSTRLNSSHSQISYAVFCLKKKKKYPEDIEVETRQHRMEADMSVTQGHNLSD